MAKPETRLRGPIIKALEARGYHVDSNPGSALSRPGRSDTTVCARGLYIALEIKVPGEDATDDQQRYLNKVRAAGGWGGVVHSPAEAVEFVERVLDHG